MPRRHGTVRRRILVVIGRQHWLANVRSDVSSGARTKAAPGAAGRWVETASGL